MVKYELDSGVPVPEANKGGRPQDPCVEVIIQRIENGMNESEAIEASIPEYIERGSENWYQRKKDLKKRYRNRIK